MDFNRLLYSSEMRSRVYSIGKVVSLLWFTIYLFGLSKPLLAQTDTEFWFVVPEISRSHYHSSTPIGGIPAALKFSASNLPATITISMPADTEGNFPDFTFDIPAYGFYEFSLDSWINAGSQDRDWLENKPLTPDGINNFGLHITSTAPITAYYEVNNRNNKDIWALKGRNGLGTKFYTPFQNVMNNGSYSPVQPYSAIDVVATRNGTVVTFQLPPGISASYGVGPQTTTPPGYTFTKTLNRGQTFSLFPQNQSRVASRRLAGTKITSTQPIAVTIKDDSHLHTNNAGCRDVSGDQLISTHVLGDPTNNLIGTEYIAMRTSLDQEDNLYILATQNNTNIEVFNSAGIKVNEFNNLNEQQQVHQPLPVTQAYYHIVADKPVYVLHVGGFGCEVGGAILPPIDKCTGVPRVAFARTSNEGFFIVIMVRDGAQDFFEFNGAKRDDLFPPSNFIEVPNNPGWRVGRFGYDFDPVNGFPELEINLGTHFMRNTEDIFHLGIVNGGDNTGCFYGYFSNYNEFDPQALVIDSDAHGYRMCAGEDVQLWVDGGTQYYWSPPEYFDDPTSETPIIYNIPADIPPISVNISGACNSQRDIDIDLQVAGPVTAAFTVDPPLGCAAPSTSDPTKFGVEFAFESTSIGDNERDWTYTIGNDATKYPLKYGIDGDADEAKDFTWWFENNTDDVIEYHVSLEATDRVCNKGITKTVKVYPYMDINPTVNKEEGCQPLEVEFAANPDPNGFYNNATYLWEFGDDGSDSNLENPPHTYYNNKPPYDAETYVAEVTITDQWNACKVTKPVEVIVHPLVEPKFTINQIEGCSPLTIDIKNASKGGITSWRWTMNGTQIGTAETPPSIPELLNNRNDNQPEEYIIRLEANNDYAQCLEVFERTVTVYPNPSAHIVVIPQDDIRCSPLDVNFGATNIINDDAYVWMLDGIPISSNASDSYTLDNYTATTQSRDFAFSITNEWGCRFNSDTIPVLVHPFVEAKIVIDDEVGCSPHTPNIKDASSVGVTSWEWTIDSGSDVYTSPLQDPPAFPPLIYPGSENETFIPHYVTVDLIVRNDAGCERPDQKIIQVNPTAQATFTADFYNFEGVHLDPNTDNLCSPVSADFTGTYTNAQEFNWQFGNFGSSLVENPMGIEFTNAGIKPENVEVTLLATNEFGCSAPPFKRTYILEPEVTAAFSMVADGHCVPVTIDVDAQTIYGGNPEYTWTFNDIPSGNIQTGQLTIFENKTGADSLVRISLRVSNGKCYDVSPEFVVLVHPEVQAQWDLGMNLPPECSPYELDINNVSTLHSTSIPINSATGFINWAVTDLGGNTITSGANDNFDRTIHNDSHLASKQFNLSLKATSLDGCSDSISTVIDVYPKVTAQFNVETTEICTPMELLITNSSLTTPSGSTYDWDWDGGGDTHLGGENYEVTYHNPDPNNSINRIITLDLENSYGCDDQFTYLLSVLPEVVPSFALASGSDPFHCGAGDVTFDNLSTGGTLNYLWEFDDGQHYTTTSTNPVSHSFSNVTTGDMVFNVKLTAENLYDCSDDYSIPIRVHPRVEADFSFTIPDECAYPLEVDFVNNSKFAASAPNINTGFHWDYGYTWGGVPQDDVRPDDSPHSYSFYNNLANATSTYTITLNPQQYHQISGLTCQDTQTRTITVYPELIANFTLDNAEGCNPLTVEYNNNSSGVIPASGGYFQWDLGDNSGETALTPPKKVYSHFDKTQAITYPVTLTVTNPLGCKKDYSRDVKVYPWVEAAFSLDKIDGCTPLNVEVSNLSKSVAYTYQWDFTGGTPANSTSADPGTITYINTLAPPATLDILHPTLSLVTGLNQGIYPIGDGCAKTVSEQIAVFPHVYPSFDGDLTGCHPLDVNFTNTSGVFGGTNNGEYVWTFGTGVVSNHMNHSQTYFNPSLTDDKVYTGKLKAISQHGCKDSINFNVVVFPKPQSRMELVSDYMACSPFDAEIQNLSVGKGMNGSLEFNFDFGDGNNLTTHSMDNITHTFQNLSPDIVPYMITLHVETEDGCEDTSYQTIHVYPEVTAQFAFNPGDAACNPFTVQHQNSSTNAWYYEWNFDDGGFLSYLHSPTHLYQNFAENDRVFNVLLTAMSEYDCVDTYTLPLTVYAAPDADFAINPPLKVFPDATFEFINQTFPAADGWQYTWDFGDGYGSNEKNPSDHEYETWGPIADDFRYWVRLHVENANCADSVVHPLILRPAVPIPEFDANQYQACSPLVVHFQNYSMYGHTFEWDFGDGTTSNEEEPIHTFYEPGVYNVRLRVIGDGGERSFYKVFEVFENPIARFVVNPEETTLPDAKVFMYSLSENATSYFWEVGDGTTYTSRDVVHTYQEMGLYKVKLTVYSDEWCIDTTSKSPAVRVVGAGYVKFPNAFVPSKLGPNGGYYDEVDYKNEVFHPVHLAVVDYKLMIFNRWGEQIFESKDIKVGWDGYHNGKLCTQDVYVYRAIGRYSNGKTFDIKGNVTLMR